MVEPKTPGQRTRGSKRQNELRSPECDAAESKKRIKRTRKVNLSEADILNVIDEEELHKRAAQVHSQH